LIFVKHLDNIDFAYLKKGEPFGETLIADVTVFGNKTDKGILVDFSHIKKRIRKLLANFDHKVLTKSKLQIASEWIVSFHYRKSRLELLLNDLINKKLPSNVTKIKISLHRETGNFSFFNYTHGLKFHHGGCYNILHGHYNKFEVYRHGKRFPVGEKWAHRKYLAKSPYITSNDYILKKTQKYYLIGYDRNIIKIKKDKVIIIQGFPTIENISEHFFKILTSKFGRVEVIFYEGINKGCYLRNDNGKNTRKLRSR
jgi:6-pyruvoyl-tetrahydropterin synthase